MDEPRDKAAEFRASATRAYRIICAVLVALGLVAGWIGWHFGHWVGLAIGAVIGLLVAGLVWFAVTLLWAMTQADWIKRAMQRRGGDFSRRHFS